MILHAIYAESRTTQHRSQHRTLYRIPHVIQHRGYGHVERYGLVVGVDRSIAFPGASVEVFRGGFR